MNDDLSTVIARVFAGVGSGEVDARYHTKARAVIRALDGFLKHHADCKSCSSLDRHDCDCALAEAQDQGLIQDVCNPWDPKGPQE